MGESQVGSVFLDSAPRQYMGLVLVLDYRLGAFTRGRLGEYSDTSLSILGKKFDFLQWLAYDDSRVVCLIL